MNEMEQLVTKYRALNLQDILHYEKFNQYAITHHSTALEGNTLTIEETKLLLDEGLTPKGKPLQHSLMAKDHYEALLFVIDAAKSNLPVTPTFIQAINAQVMKNTGSVYNTVFGSIDGSKGSYRKGNVTAGGSYFVNYDKVLSLIEKLVMQLNESIAFAATMQEQIDISFTAHFDLVTIHPFYDGNGRTSRLLMNYIQQVFHLPLAIVFTEDKAAYYEALQDTRKMEDISLFLQFMYSQYKKYLAQEIAEYQKLSDNKSSKGYSFVF